MPDPSKPNLTILNGPQSGTNYEMDTIDNLLIGSDSSCPFFIDAPGISPIHARIWLDAEGCTVFDTHSPTGIYINDDRVAEKAPLRNGDILWLGSPGDEASVMIQVSLPGSGVPLATPAISSEEGPPAEMEMAPEAETIVAQPPAFEEPPVVSGPVEMEPTDFGEMVASPPAIEESAAEPPLFAESEPAPPTLKSFRAEEPAETMVGAAPPLADSGFEFEESAVEVTPEPASAPAEAFEFAESSEPPPLPIEPVVEVSAETQAVAFIDEPEPDTVLVAPSAPEPAPETISEPPAFFAEEPAFFSEELATIAVAPAAPIEHEVIVDETPAAPPAAPAPPAPVTAPSPPKPAEAKPPVPKPEVKKAGIPRRPTTPAAPRVAAAPRPAPRPAPRGGGGSSPVVYGAIGFVVVAVLVAGGWYFMGQKGTPLPSPPATVAAVTTLPPPDVTAPPESPTPAPPVEEVVSLPTPPPATVAAAIPTKPPVTLAAKPTPIPKPTPSPATTPPPATTPAPPTAAQLAAQVGAQVQTALGKADASVAARNYAEAVTHFDEALKLEPGNARATSGKGAASAALASLRKAFVAGKTSFIGKAKKGPAGFDDNEPADPDYQGRVDFEFSPPNVKPGDPYTAKVYLANDGKKPIKITGLTVATVTNGQRTGGPANAQAKEVGPGQRGLLADVSGTWKEGTNNWSLDVAVTSGRGETYTSRANWR